LNQTRADWTRARARRRVGADLPATEQFTLREPTPDDAAALGQIVFDAFGDIHDYHRFERDFPVMEIARGIIENWVAHPSIWGVVAEVDGRVVGSNFLDERDPIRGVGPITVSPIGQNAGVGRRLMEAVIERGKDAAGIRLLQDGFHMRSLCLYESLGFDVKEPVAVTRGEPRSAPVDRVEVRRMADTDLEECSALCERVHGFARTNELRDAVGMSAAFVAVRDGRVSAYASNPLLWPMSHGVAESDEEMIALLLGVAAQVEGPIAFLVPLRSPLFRWSISEGLRLVKPMNVMAIGEYREPRGSWFPSVLY
jgi:GNAT superfamily N-acetyltransferase